MSILISLLAAPSDAGAEEVTGSVTPTEEGAAKTVTFSAPGDSAALSVPVAAGESVSIVSSEAGLSGAYRLEWLNPEGESVRAWSPPGGSDRFFEPVRFEETGEATLLIDPEGSATGPITFTLYDASDKASSISLAGGGETKTLTVGAPGQRRLVHFEGSEGQHVSLVPSGAGFEGEFHVNTPAGEALEGSGGTLEGTHGPLILPEAGTYTLVLTGDGAQTGSVSLDFEDSSMVVAYGFDEGEGDEVRDESGLAHIGEIEGATWADAARGSGHSLYFDGVEGCLTVHESTGIDLQHGFTVDAWIRPEALWVTETNEEMTIFEVPAGEVSPAVALVVGRTTQGILEAVVGEETVGEFSVASDPEEVEWGRWQYVAMTFDGTHLKLYVGGELVGQATVGLPVAGAGPMTVGCSRTTPNTFGRGIDELRVYTRALTGGEIADDEATQVQPVHLDVYGQLPNVPEGGFDGVQSGLFVRASAKGEAEIEGLELKVDGEPVDVMSRTEALEDGGFEYCSENICYLGYEYRSVFPPGMASGEHTVSIVAIGVHGKKATFEKTVKVDASPPVIHLSGRLYEDDGVATEDPEELAVSATDEGPGAGGIESVTFHVDGEWAGARSSPCEGGCGADLEASYEYSANEWGGEPHELSVTAADAAGNTTTKTLIVERSPEAIELQVTGQLGEAAEGGVVGIQEGLPVRASTKGEAEIEGFELKVDGEPVAAASRTEVLEGGGSESCTESRCYLSYEFKSIFPPGLASGVHTVSVIALSHHGRKTLYKKTVRVDADPPVLHLSGKLYEESGLLTEESEELAMSATDGEGENSSGVKSVGIYVNGTWEEGTTSACEGGCGGSLGTSYTYSQKEWGGNPRELTVTAVDAAGNKTSDTFTVEQPAPAVKPECGSAECTDIWTGPAEGSWNSSKYWSAEHVPTASDVVYIGAGKSVSVAGASSAASVHVEGALSVERERSLELSSPTETSIISELVGEFSTLSGQGNITVTKSLHWTFATMAGVGATVLSSGAVAQIQGLTLRGRTFTNDGTVSSTSGIEMSEGAIFRNEGVFTYPGSIISGGSETEFVNTGIFTNGSGSSSWGFVDVPFVNEGTVEARSKPMVFGEHAVISRGGDWVAAEGGELTFWRGTFEGVGGSLSGEVIVAEGTAKIRSDVRTVELSLTVTGEKQDPITGDEEGGATVEVDQLELALQNLKLSWAATLTGPGDVYISGSLGWYYGAKMEGTGRVTLLPAAIARAERPHSAGDAPTLKQTFVNEGTFELNDSWMMFEGDAIFDNLGTFIYSSRLLAEGYASNVIPYKGAESAMFVNAGTFENTSFPGTLTVGVPFANEGTIKVAREPGVIIQHPVALKSSEHAPEEACGQAGDPVACATGNFTEAQADLEVGGRGVGLDLTRTYSAQAAAAGSLGIFGYGWTNSFGDHLTSEEGAARETLTEASGGTVPFARSGAAYVAPSWSQDVLTGSAEVGFTLTLPDQIKEKFSGSGRLESVTDRNGNATTLSYDGSGELETITDPSGQAITLAYDAEGLVEEATDPMGHVVRYAYESKNLKSVTLPGETSPNWQFKYDGSHRMTSMTDGRGGKTSNEYDGSNRVISQTDPAGRTLTWKYEPFHTTITNETTGAVTDEWFNSNNQPRSITRGYGTASASTDTFAYTAAGLLASRTDGDGHTTTYGYDAAGNRTGERNAEGDETMWTYNEAHEVTSETTPGGEKTTISRNADGNPETVSRPAPESKTQTVSYEYGPHGEVETMTDPLGHVWSYGYDKYGNRTSETDLEGDEQTWGYNEDSQVISKVSPRGNEEGAEAAKYTTSIERDAQGRPVKVTDQLGETTKFAYDPDGNIESITDPNGRKTKFTNDADNERTKVERPNGAVEETGYDGAGQITSQTDGDKHKTTYIRNVLEQPIEVIDPLERKSVQTFDAAGNLKTKTDPDSRTTTFGYDNADRLKEIAYSAEASQDVTFGYNEDGEPTTMKDGTGESTWEYDQLCRLIHAKSGHGETVSWAYNLDDEPVGLTYPNGKSISRAYDKAGRLESVTDWLGHTTSFAYNRDSEPTATTFPVGTSDKDEYGYDRADRMASVTMKKGVETLASLAYSRDPVGQLESLISKGLASTEEESFTYDENERLTKAGAAEFGYDAANNITKAPGTTNAYDTASQIESATGASFTFDKEGERTKETPGSGPATTYKYDQAGDLATIERVEEGETPAIAESFGYGGTGLLASRTVGPSTAHFVWDLSESPELLLSDGEDSYVYGPGGLAVESISAGEVPTYLHHDQLGSTRILTNSYGEVAGTFTYGAYGGLSGHTGTATTALGYAGQYTLAPSGLQYLRARFYDPGTAQFMTRDPIESITRSPYGYAKQNPVGRIDPSGLCGVSSVGDFLESINPISEENCAYEAASSASAAVSNISLPSIREAAEAEVGFFDGATVGLTKYAREIFGIGNGGLALCGSVYDDAGTVGAIFGGLVAVYTPDGALEVASRFPRASRWLAEHGDEATQIKDIFEEVIRHTVGK